MAQDDTLDGGRHPDQLVPVAMPYHNRVMQGPPGTDIQDVSTYVGPDASRQYAVTSLAYTLVDDRQREMIANGAHIVMEISQVPMPPVALIIEGPFCDLHQREKVWAEGSWHCESCLTDGSSPEDPGTHGS